MEGTTVNMSSVVFIAEAARIVGVSEATLRNWESAGRLVPQRIGGARVYDRGELERIARARRNRASGNAG